jgi:tetratricopeptide (TPR) repeat protein
MYNLAIYHEYNKNYAEAYKLYKSILKANELFTDAYCKLALLSYYRGNVKKAFEYINKAIEKYYDKEKYEEERLKQGEAFNLHSIIKLKVINCMNKPSNPILLKAVIEWKNVNAQEALKTLATLMTFENSDPFTLVLIGNVNYDMAYHHRASGSKVAEFNTRIQKAIEFYFAALDLDPSNAYAAIGLANCMAEFNITGPALDVYKSVGEKLFCCYSRLLNEALIYINDKKFNKALNILSKVILRMKESNHPDLVDAENIYVKALLENGEFDKGINLLKYQIHKSPDNLMHRYNLGVALKMKAENVLNNQNSKVKESIEAKVNLEKAIDIFTAVNKLRKEKKIIVSKSN